MCSGGHWSISAKKCSSEREARFSRFSRFFPCRPMGLHLPCLLQIQKTVRHMLLNVEPADSCLAA